MKKIISIACLIILCLSIMGLSVFAESVTATTSGPANVQVGQTFDVSLALNGSGIHGVQGKVRYDKTVLQLNDITAAANGWKVDYYNDIFVAYDNDSEHPINKKTNVIVVSFTLLKGDASSTVNVKFENLIATDTKKDFPANEASYVLTISATPTAIPATPTAVPVTPTAAPATPTAAPATPTAAPATPTAAPATPTTAPVTPTAAPATPTAVPVAPVDPTAEPDATVAPTIETTADATVTPTDAPVGQDKEDENKCSWWWILIIIAIAFIIWFIIVLRKKKRDQEEA